MIRGIHHTAISTGDLERALGFYRDLLGFEVVMDWTWPEGTAGMNLTHQLPETSGRVALLGLGNAMLELFEYATPPPAPRAADRRMVDHGITHLCLDVDDLDAEFVRLREAGVSFHCEPVDYGTVKVTYMRDPDGNVLELQEVKSRDDALFLDALKGA
jgi:catechol 2,3-dioxygenase-like lactoylglutathione lyase family enzyme